MLGHLSRLGACGGLRQGTVWDGATVQGLVGSSAFGAVIGGPCGNGARVEIVVAGQVEEGTARGGRIIAEVSAEERGAIALCPAVGGGASNWQRID